MRVIAGKLKGRNLKMPRGIRPTAQKVKGAVFDILGERITGSVVLDLFAGSGALGIEAISRGAGSVTFVDNNRASLQTIKANLKTCGLLGPGNKEAEVRILSMSALRAARFFSGKARRFDFIFLDPPYYRDIAKKALINLADCDILNTSGLLIIEHYKKDILLPQAGSLCLVRRARYGDTVISFYRYHLRGGKWARRVFDEKQGSLSR